MWDRRKLLLAAIVLTALHYRVDTEDAKLLSMAPDAVEYLNSKCRKEAIEEFIHSGLLGQELNRSKAFKEAWNANENICQKAVPGGIKGHTTALLAYLNGNKEFTETFNNEVKTMGGNVSTYENNFHFKSLYFLLMDYMMIQKPNKCETVYVFIDEQFPAKKKKHSNVTLKGFTLAEQDFNELKKFEDLDGAFVLNITSCFFVKLGDNICRKGEKHILLSPAEVFTVESENIKSPSDYSDDSYTEIVLKHSHIKRPDYCPVSARSPADVSTRWLVLVLVALSVFFFNF